MLRVLLALALCGSAQAAVAYSAQALKSEITALPGVPVGTNFKMFSGHIPLPPLETGVEGDRALFYWFVESQNKPATDPVVLWSNGGPGCSGLGGFMTEQGPFRPNADGTLSANEQSWNKIANVVFIEQPAGVGFSYSHAEMNYTDAQAAKDNAAFVRGFLHMYDAYNTSDFYITSESYGGHYMPTLAKELVQQRGACWSDKDCSSSYCMNDKTKSAPYKCHSGKGFTPNFKGFMVGNPLTYMPYRDYGMYSTFAGHNLLPKPLWDKYLSLDCKKKDTTDKACSDLMNKFNGLTAGLDPYALDFPVCSTTKAVGRHERHTILKAMGRLNGYFPQSYQPCAADYGASYLNTPAVQKAIGVEGLNVTWALCSDAVGGKYSQTDVVEPMMPYYQWLIKNAPDLSILVYSGDDDAVCATAGSQEWIWDLGYSIADEWAPWMFGKQVGGYRVSFGTNGSAFQFVTVHGAGHMVPSTRPEQGLQVLSNYLKGKW